MNEGAPKLEKITKAEAQEELNKIYEIGFGDTVTKMTGLELYKMMESTFINNTNAGQEIEGEPKLEHEELAGLECKDPIEIVRRLKILKKLIQG